jgi:cell division protein FtsZ
MEDFEEKDDKLPLVDFGPVEDKSKGIIKVIGVGGGGCNAVNNMYREGIVNVTFAVLNTDSQSLQKSPVTVKLPLGETGLGAGANPEIGKGAAMSSIEQIHKLLDDGTKMVFITAGMGGGTGTGAAPIVAGEAKKMGILTIGIVTIPFYFEKKKKIIKALHGVEEMRKNVDALLIINNERICDIFSNEEVAVKDAFKRADQILSDATKSISELITVEGDINLDFCDVESTLRGGGGAIMAMGRGEGEHRVEKSVVDALDSPLIYGNDIDKAKRILLNIYTSKEHPLLISEMNEIDQFMDALDPNIDVIWGVSNDNTLKGSAKVTILATGFEDYEDNEQIDTTNDNYFEEIKEYIE